MHIDGLYHGALFLQGGEESTAEDLVLWTMTGAFKQFKRIERRSVTEQWLEGKLVEAFLARAGLDWAAGESVPVFLGDAPDRASARGRGPRGSPHGTGQERFALDGGSPIQLPQHRLNDRVD